MTTSSNNHIFTAIPVTRIALALLGAMLLGGCIVREVGPRPPPQRVYVARPPVYERPAYEQPASEQPAYDQPAYDQPAYDQSAAEVELRANEAPPPLPEYEQPPCPEDGYLWTPGYWGYGGGGYFWVPGTWAQPPRIGVLWTPGYWGFVGGFYAFHLGYWGPHVGFYGGVNYGYGYGGVGFPRNEGIGSLS